MRRDEELSLGDDGFHRCAEALSLDFPNPSQAIGRLQLRLNEPSMLCIPPEHRPIRKGCPAARKRWCQKQKELQGLAHP